MSELLLKYLHAPILGPLLKTGQYQNIPLIYDCTKTWDEKLRTEFVETSGHTFNENYCRNYCWKSFETNCNEKEVHFHNEIINVYKISNCSRIPSALRWKMLRLLRNQLWKTSYTLFQEIISYLIHKMFQTIHFDLSTLFRFSLIYCWISKRFLKIMQILKAAWALHCIF